MSVWVAVWIMAGGLPAAARAQSPDVVEYYHLDGLGSVRAVTDAAGAVVRTSDYRPFGEGENPPAGAVPARFTGKERDRESGLDYVGARYYASRSGRFTTVDPGHVGGNIFDPQSWNAYAYARNNPLKYVDPTGTDYMVNIEGGSPFQFHGDYAQFSRFAAGYGLEGPLGGTIFNAFNQPVGSYEYCEPMACLLGDIGRRSAPAVYLAAGATVFMGGATIATAASTAVGSAAIGLGIRTWAPSLPLGMKVAEFGRLINWSNSRDPLTNLRKTEELMRNLPGRLEELRKAGVTHQMALEWAKFYAAEAARNPANPNAAARERLMRAIANGLR